jgi:hypothetical protein
MTSQRTSAGRSYGIGRRTPPGASGQAPGTAAPFADRRRREPGELFGTRFVLFADMLAVGLITAVACLPVITAPAAFAAACAVLRESISAERPATLGRYLTVLRRLGLRRSLTAGALALAAVALVVLDLLLARAGLPGARWVSPVVAAAAVAALVVGLRAAADERVAQGWRGAVRAAAARSAADLPGCALVLAAVLLSATLAWMLPLLAPLAPGALAFAVTAVELRAAPTPAPSAVHAAEPAGAVGEATPQP